VAQQSFKSKVLILSLVSLLSIFFLSYFLIREARTSLEEAKNLEKSIAISTQISALVHELQKERGRTAGFLGTKGTDFKKELLEQRKATDEEIAKLEKYLTKGYVSSLPEDAQEVFLSVIVNRLNDLSQIRLKVDSLQVSLQEAVSFYTNLNESLIDSVALLARHTRNSEIARELLSYADFMYAKDKAGLERAVLSVAFGNKKFPTQELFNSFVKLLAQQEAFLKAFSMAAPDTVRSFYEKTVPSSEVSLEVLNYEKLSLSSPFEGTLNVDPDRWFSTITKKIDLMHRVETYIAKDLLSRISLLKSQAESRFYIVLLVVALSALVIFVVAGISLKERKG
jgi:methyl-accepting chemotaxis protein